MASIAEDDIETFLTSLRTGDIDKKINLLQLWGIKLEGVSELPERRIDAITVVVAPLVRGSSQLLVTSTLSGFLPIFIPLVPAVSPQPHMRLIVAHLLPGLLERLNDPKDKIHDPAKELIAAVGQKCYAADRADPSASTSSNKGKDKDSVSVTWENAVKDVLGGRLARAKVGALKMLVSMREDKTAKLPLKPWLPSLVNLLEDSDGGVRDQARETVVALVSPPAPPAARSELKKLLLQRNVRKSIADGILARVMGSASTPSTPAAEAEGVAPRDTGSRSGATTPAVADDVPIVYIASPRDLENEMRPMVAHFAGKETEHNWLARERDLLRIRGMLRGKVFSQLPDAFVMNLKGGILEGIAKTLVSLRTTVAQHSCALVQELAENLGSSFDPLVEPFLEPLGKMAGYTKRIIAERSQKAVGAIIRNCTAYRLLLGHILAGVQDKSVQARQYNVAHLKEFLNTMLKSPAVVDTLPMDEVEQALRKCLGDVNPQVREQARLTFWVFDKISPRRAAAILDSLDGTARKQLEKANGGGGGTASTTSTPAKPTVPRPRASAAILAAKRAKAAELAAERKAAEQADRERGDDHETVASTPAMVALARSLEPMSPSPAASASRRREPLVAVTPIQSGTANISPLVDMSSAVGTPAGKDVDADEHKMSVSPPAPTLGKLPLEPKTPTNALGLKSPGNDASLSRPQPAQAIASLKSPTLSNRSSRSRSPSLARSLSRSPPSARDSLHQPFRNPGVRSVEASSEASGTPSIVRTPPEQQRFSHAKAAPRRSEPLVSMSPAGGYSPSFNSVPSPSPATPQRRGQFYPRAPVDAAEEARRAQVAQGLSAAQQLIDFDDDQMPMSVQAPMTPAPARQPQSAADLHPFRTPRNGNRDRGWQVWEDSPKVMTPQVVQRLEGRSSERKWWIQRRELLEQVRPYKKEALGDGGAIEADVEALAAGRPSVINLRRLTAFSEQHTIALPRQPDEHRIPEERAVWDADRLFDRVLHGLLAFLEPHQPQELLEWGLVLLWDMVENQWVLFENQEDAVLDAFFRLRSQGNSVILEATNALTSLLADVCDPPFLLSLLHSALDRYLQLHPSGSSEPHPDGVEVGDSARAAGYTYGLNAMGMCILHLPKEAVEVEAKRLDDEIIVAINDKGHLPSRQAAYGVVLAIQCMLGDDVRTLSLFPRLSQGQKAFVTYLMKERGLLERAAGDAEGASRRQSVMEGLVDGMAKRVPVRRPEGGL